MALTIQKRSWKNRDGSTTEKWRLIIQDYTSGERKDYYPKQDDYKKYGFDQDDSFTEAKKKLKAIQARNKIARSAELRARAFKRRDQDDLKDEAFLPSHLYSRFLVWLKQRRLWDAMPDKTTSHLRCMRKLVVELGVDPWTWPDRPELVYRFFLRNSLSVSYLQKVLPLLNEYGYFYCREYARPFLAVPAPPGDIARRIEDANLTERDGSQKASTPIYPAMLGKLSDLPPEQFEWMRFSVYFGLRPSEIDDLVPKNEGKAWRVTKDPKGILILHYYQKKLTAVERERRWKRIPCILSDQTELAKQLQQGIKLRRPLLKSIKMRLGEGYGLYGGRKGFEKFMRESGQKFINISRWLGHTDIRRTEWNYRETEAVEWDEVSPSAARPQTVRDL